LVSSRLCRKVLNDSLKKFKTGGTPGKRKNIGKFGIGKLATYLLCNELTYICKFSDGIIRIVTTDYRAIDEVRHKEGENLKLSVRVLDEKGLKSVLEGSCLKAHNRVKRLGKLLLL
jgi:hypothetical protein